MKKSLLLLLLLLLTVSFSTSAIARKKRTQTQEAPASVEETVSEDSKATRNRATAQLAAQTINVTLSQPDREEQPWYESPVLTGFAGAVGGFLLTGLTGFINRWFANKQAKGDHKRKQYAYKSQKQLDELKTVYQETTLGMNVLESYSRAFKKLAGGDQSGKEWIESQEEVKLYEYIQSIREHVELHIDSLLPEVEKIWKAFRDANSEAQAARDTQFKDTKQLTSVADQYDRVLKLLKGIKAKAAKHSRDLLKL